MGAAGSTQVVVKGAAQPLPSLHSTQASPEIDEEQLQRKRRQAQEAYRLAEDVLYQEGYRKGQSDVLARIDAEAELKSNGVFGRLQQEAEDTLAKKIAAQAEALSKRGFRAPLASTACVEEESALLTCDPAASRDKCVATYKAYETCAQGVMHKAMNPALR